MDEAEFREQMKKLYRQLVDQRNQMAATLETFRALLVKEATPAEKSRLLFDVWALTWQARYSGDTYVFSGARDGAQFKRLLKILPAKEIERRMHAFMASDDPFHVKARHSLPVFVATINAFGAESTETPFELAGAAAVGCKHLPRCTSDVVHTKRIMRDMRGEA